MVGTTESTLSRELKRNANKNGSYSCHAHEMAMERRERSTSNSRVDPSVLKESLKLLKEQQWSPEQISGYLKHQGKKISKERIYQEIRADETGELKKHCRHKMKYRHHVAKPKKTAGRSLIPDRVSIHDRPEEADGKRFGDWEMDLVMGADQKSAVLTMIERSTNILLQSKLPSKKPDEVKKAVYRLLLPYKGKVLTITTDNGIEFREHKWLCLKLRTTVYFADPYCSGQKGAVENANKLLRQYFPKGTDFRNVSQAQLDAVQKKINNRPRKKLGFSTPKIEFFKHFH